MLGQSNCRNVIAETNNSSRVRTEKALYYPNYLKLAQLL
jgi:hypothetical protein